MTTAELDAAILATVADHGPLTANEIASHLSVDVRSVRPR